MNKNRSFGRFFVAHTAAFYALHFTLFCYAEVSTNATAIKKINQDGSRYLDLFFYLTKLFSKGDNNEALPLHNQGQQRS